MCHLRTGNVYICQHSTIVNNCQHSLQSSRVLPALTSEQTLAVSVDDCHGLHKHITPVVDSSFTGSKVYQVKEDDIYL